MQVLINELNEVNKELQFISRRKTTIMSFNHVEDQQILVQIEDTLSTEKEYIYLGQLIHNSSLNP